MGDNLACRLRVGNNISHGDSDLISINTRLRLKAHQPLSVRSNWSAVEYADVRRQTKLQSSLENGAILGQVAVLSGFQEPLSFITADHVYLGTYN